MTNPVIEAVGKAILNASGKYKRTDADIALAALQALKDNISDEMIAVIANNGFIAQGVRRDSPREILEVSINTTLSDKP
jgi:hypothetical protein